MTLHQAFFFTPSASGLPDNFVQEYTTAGTYYWTAPGTGTYYIGLYLVGGGGAGYGTYSELQGADYSGGGGGGGGGATWGYRYQVTGGTEYTLVVGSAGNSTHLGSNPGGASYFKQGTTNLVIGYGGEAGEQEAGGYGGDASVVGYYQANGGAGGPGDVSYDGEMGGVEYANSGAVAGGGGGGSVRHLSDSNSTLYAGNGASDGAENEGGGSGGYAYCEAYGVTITNVSLSGGGGGGASCGAPGQKGCDVEIISSSEYYTYTSNQATVGAGGGGGCYGYGTNSSGGMLVDFGLDGADGAFNGGPGYISINGPYISA